MLFGGPRDEIGTQIDTVARSRAAVSGVPGPIGVTISSQMELTGMELKTKMKSALNIAQDLLDSGKVSYGRRMHVLTGLIDSVRELRSGDGEIL